MGHPFQQRSACRLRLIVFASLLILGTASSATAQFAPQGSGLGGLILADRNRIRVFRQAKELIADGQYVDALELLQKLLETQQDQLIPPDPESPDGSYRSFKAEIQRQIGNLPAAGRAVYLRNAAPIANVLLKEAIENKDGKKLADVARSYFHTPAGYSATYRIALEHFDHGEPMTAALILERLRKNPHAAKQLEPMLSLRTAIGWLQAGMPEEAEKTFASLRGRREISMAGRRESLFKKGGQPADWISRLNEDSEQKPRSRTRNWMFPKGRASRNAVLARQTPEQGESWVKDTVLYHPDLIDPEDPLIVENDRRLNGFLASQRKQRESRAQHLLPGLRPIVVHGVVFSRMLAETRGFDLATGELVHDSMNWDLAVEAMTGFDELPALPNANQLMPEWLSQKVWHDQTAGQLSSDGERLYSLEFTGFWQSLPAKNRPAVPVTSTNVLTAYNLKTSKQIWEVGGPPKNPPQKVEEHYFLGPPLPIAGRLYCLAEYANEVRLVVLDAESGNLEWQQPLASVSQQRITADRERRTSGVSVAYADGVLVCPTDLGATIALDLTTRSLLWGYPTEIASAFQRNPRNRARPATLGRQVGWLDSTPTIGQGMVVLTPLKSEKIYLLDLQTGEPVWNHPRGDGLYVAGIQNNQVIVVGQNLLQSWNTKNGKSTWEGDVKLSDTPTGRGVIVDSKLILPAGKQLLVIDLKNGREIGTMAVDSSIKELGNLIVADGRLISRSAAQLSVLPFPTVLDKR